MLRTIAIALYWIVLLTLRFNPLPGSRQPRRSGLRSA